MGDGLAALKQYKQVSRIKHGAPTSEVGLSKTGEIVVGKFVDRVRPDFHELMRAEMEQSLGNRFVENFPMENSECQS
jgi:2-oxoglutarate ferredoxin oxidoreductase subunit beta